MVVGVGGIGNFRDLGDPNDPRRGISAPQPNATPGLPGPQVVYPEITPSAAELANQTWQPGAVPLEWIVEARRIDRAQNPDSSSAPLPPPTQNPPASPTNTEYIDREYGISRGFGAGGGAQVSAPMVDSADARWRKTKDGWSAPLQTRQVQQRNPAGGSVSYKRAAAEPDEAVSSLIGPVPTEEARQFLEKIESGMRKGRTVGEIQGVREIQTNEREKRKGFGNIPQSDIDENYTGSRPVPNTTATEISPFYTVDVPLVGPDRQVKKGENRSAVKRIDPRAAFLTEQADRDTIRNAQHANEEEVTISNAKIADELRQEHRTPLITTETFAQGLRNGQIRQVTREGNHVADLITEDGLVPIYATGIREEKGSGNGQEEKMFRVGRPTNVNEDAIRDKLNPRYRTHSSAFDTQVVRTGAIIRPDENGVRRAKTEGFAVETGPSTFLNRDDIYASVPGMRRNIEAAASTKPLRRGGSPRIEHLPESVQAGIARALADRPQGGTRKERIAADTASPFVREGKNGKYIDTNALANSAEGLETAVASLDQVLKELAGGQYMSDPDVANGYQRMAIEIEAGRLDPRAVPERARQEVAQYQAVLRAAAAPVERVPIQSQPTITEVVLDNPADLVAEEINGPARNFDSDGRVVQGKYGDFSELDDGKVNGVTVYPAPELDNLELAQARRVVDEMFGLSNAQGGISLENQARLDQLSRAVLDDAMGSFPASMVNSEPEIFQAALRRSADRLGGNPARVVQGRSMPIRTPNDQAVVETGTALPQTQQAGVANTESVSQLNAPAPVDPEVARLLPYVGNGVRQSQIDLISKGLAAESGSATRNAADQLLSLFRRRFR